jgi:plasmid stabilization system protein ParE
MKVELTEPAFKDLENTLEYYADQGVPEQGRRLAAELLQKSERLAKYPESGRIVPEFSVPFLRELIVPPYRLVYKIEPKNILIIRVWRSERLLKLD